MKNATQSEIDKFYSLVENDPKIYPFIGIGKFLPRWTEQKDNNACLVLTDDRLSYSLNITFNWRRPLEFEVALFSRSRIGGGRGLLALQEQIKRYRPKAVNTSVQASNNASLKINRKLWGMEWGVEPLVAWNPLKGCYENLHYFRKIY